MSAFVVKDKVISSVVVWIRNNIADLPQLERTLKEMGYNLSSVNWDTKLAGDLYKMNIEAVNQRYDRKTEPNGFQYDPTYLTRPVQTFKNAGCLSYQCSEGDVFKTELYRFLADVENAIARKVVYQLPEYDRANWD